MPDMSGVALLGDVRIGDAVVVVIVVGIDPERGGMTVQYVRALLLFQHCK